MDIGSSLLILAIALIAGLVIIRPFMDKAQAVRALVPPPGETPSEEKIKELERDLEALFQALEELDYEQETQKLTIEEYNLRKPELAGQAAKKMSELESVKRRNEKKKTPRKQTVSAGKRPSPEDDEIEALVAARRRQRLERSTGFCAQCGHVLVESDVFCARCGQEVNKESKRKKP